MSKFSTSCIGSCARSDSDALRCMYCYVCGGLGFFSRTQWGMGCKHTAHPQYEPPPPGVTHISVKLPPLYLTLHMYVRTWYCQALLPSSLPGKEKSCPIYLMQQHAARVTLILSTPCHRLLPGQLTVCSSVSCKLSSSQTALAKWPAYTNTF